MAENVHVRIDSAGFGFGKINCRVQFLAKTSQSNWGAILDLEARKFNEGASYFNIKSGELENSC